MVNYTYTICDSRRLDMQAMPLLNRAFGSGSPRALARGAKPPVDPQTTKQKAREKMTETSLSKKKKSGSEQRIKGKVIGFRADPLEVAEIEAAANEAGLTVGSFIRDTILKRARTTPTKKATIDRILLTKLLGEIGKVGSNLNQIARRLNEGGAVGLTRIGRSLDELAVVREAILQAIRQPYDNQGQEQGGPEQSGGLPVTETRE